ncbi:MAG TPA: transposase [Myxococcota bacterium]|jgi:putative transposase
MPSHFVRRPALRFPRATYGDVNAVFFVTTCVLNRERAFENKGLALATMAIIRERAQLHDVDVHAFCIMPDHAHLVLRASPSCDVVDFVAQVKGLSARASWSFDRRGALWQPSFWDRRLRDADEVKLTAEYVIANPVRARLVANPSEYPFRGGSVLEHA